MTAPPSPGKASSFGEFTFPVDSRLGVVRRSHCPVTKVPFSISKALAELALTGAFAFLGHCRGVLLLQWRPNPLKSDAADWV